MTQKLKNTGSGEEVSRDEGVRLAPEPPGALRCWPPLITPNLRLGGGSRLRSRRPGGNTTSPNELRPRLPPALAARPGDDSPRPRSAPAAPPPRTHLRERHGRAGASEPQRHARGRDRGLRAGRAGPAGFKRVAGGAQQLGGRGWGRDAAHASPQARLLPAPSSYWLTLDSPPRRQRVALLSPHSGRLQTSAGTPRERGRRLSGAPPLQRRAAPH